jgi:hypothetical protein
MEAAEMAASRVITGGAFTEEADECFSVPVSAELAQADLTYFE